MKLMERIHIIHELFNIARTTGSRAPTWEECNAAVRRN